MKERDVIRNFPGSQVLGSSPNAPFGLSAGPRMVSTGFGVLSFSNACKLTKQHDAFADAFLKVIASSSRCLRGRSQDSLYNEKNQHTELLSQRPPALIYKKGSAASVRAVTQFPPGPV